MGPGFDTQPYADIVLTDSSRVAWQLQTQPKSNNILLCYSHDSLIFIIYRQRKLVSANVCVCALISLLSILYPLVAVHL